MSDRLCNKCGGSGTLFNHELTAPTSPCWQCGGTGYTTITTFACMGCIEKDKRIAELEAAVTYREMEKAQADAGWALELEKAQAEVARLMQVLDTGVGKDALLRFLEGEERAIAAEAELARVCTWEPCHDLYTQCGEKANQYWVNSSPPKFCPYCGGNVQIAALLREEGK